MYPIPRSWPHLVGRTWTAARVFLLASIAGIPHSTHAAGIELSATDVGNAVEVSWTSPSVTVGPPFLHYEFQVQTSSNLVHWNDFGSLVPGGTGDSAVLPRSVRLGRDAEARFARLTYRLNLPASDLRGADFSGADLRNANLANANLTGANLTDTDLAGASVAGSALIGANLTRANLAGVTLDGLDLSGLDLSSIRGMPRINRMTGPADADVTTLLPRLPYNPDPDDFVEREPGMPGIVSRQNAMVMIRGGTTVEQLNTLLAAHGAAIVAGRPRLTANGHAVMILRFPTAPPTTTMRALTASIRSHISFRSTTPPSSTPANPLAKAQAPAASGSGGNVKPAINSWRTSGPS